MATIESYSRWTTSGKPVLWAEAGYIYSSTDPQEPIPPRPADQAEYFSRFISSMLSTNANGVQFWWWPGGIQQHAGKDFGVTDPDGKPRLAALTMKQWAGQAKKPRPIPTAQEKRDIALHEPT